MGSSAQLYSLSWGEFSSSLTSAVQVLRGHGDLVDVTLTAGGKSFAAHKIVLSAASPFLLEILKETPCKHPVVMLAGIDPDDLESILDFVYHGQVNVDSSQLESLLQAAHCLSIHGLSPPTLITDDGEQVPIEASIPETTLIEEPEIIKINQNNNQSGVNKKKKRRKSLSLTTTNKWPRIDDCTNDDNEEILNINREQNTEEVIDEDETSERIDTSWTITQSSTSDNGQQEHIIELKQHLHNLLPLPQYSPLHIPSYPGSMNIGMIQPATPIATTTTGTTTILSSSPTSSSSSLSFPVIQQNSITSPPPPPPPPPQPQSSSSTPSSTAVAAAAAAAAAAKIRGASDCPGQCSFCGATLRQARNLRRHILSSCKYRFSNQLNQQTISDQIVVEIKPEIDMSGFMGQSYMTDSGGSNSCDPIVYKTTTITTTETPLPSPTESDINLQHNGDNDSSPNDPR